MPDYYNILGIDSSSDFRAIKRAYYARAKACHPDRHGNSQEKTEEFKQVVEAFNVLSDPVKRDQYDTATRNRENARVAEVSRIWPRTVMDNPGDDDLEELITGNSMPVGGNLATLMEDLASTEVFMTFREGKNLFFQKRYRAAKAQFIKAVGHSPDNILYHCYLARSCAVLKDFRRALKEYNHAIDIGSCRTPPQELRRIRHELETLKKHRSPWWYKLFALFGASRDEFSEDTRREMINETNRTIAGIEAKRKRRELEQKPERKRLK